MKVTVYEIQHDKRAFIEGFNDLQTIQVDTPCIISVDGGTNTTGLSIITTGGSPLYAFKLRNEHTGVHKALRFKLEFKEFCKGLIAHLLPNLKGIYYEAPFLNYTNAVKPLYVFETAIPELLIENEDFSRIPYQLVNNKVWKKHFFEHFGESVNTKIDCVNTDKVVILNCFKTKYNYTNLDIVGQDAIDSLSMGLAVTLLGDKVLPKKKFSKFKYNVLEIGDLVNEDDPLPTIKNKIAEKIKLPKRMVLEGEVREIDLTKGKKGRFLDIDSIVYENMGDTNDLLILKGSEIDGNLLLKYNLGNTLRQRGYLVILFTRCTYKKFN